MTFKEADKRLAGMANGGYRSISFERGTYKDGTLKTEIRLYIDMGAINYHSGFHSTFAEAFDALTENMRGVIFESEELPEVSA